MKPRNSHLSMSLAVALSAMVLTGDAKATTFFEQDFVCPVGGEEFTASVVGSNSTFGSRPDGRPYSPLPIYPITECPGNGFLIFKEEWTFEELAILEQAIATSEFHTMRTEETQYYRLWWLSEKIGNDANQLAQHLMVASWETDDDAPRKTRYQQAFVDAVAELERTDNEEDWFWLNLRAANARRELGQFEQAAAEFSILERNLSIVSDENARNYVTQFIADQRRLVTEQNTASEPANMVPPSFAAFRCVLGSGNLTRSEVPICESDEVQQAIARVSIESEDGRELSGAEAIRYIAENSPHY